MIRVDGQGENAHNRRPQLVIQGAPHVGRVLQLILLGAMTGMGTGCPGSSRQQVFGRWRGGKRPSGAAQQAVLVLRFEARR